MPGERPGPPGGKRDLNRRRKTQALLDAALERFLEQGVETVPIEAIAAAAGIAKGGFYRYFADKRALVEALLQPVRERIGEAFEACRASLSDASAPDGVVAAYLGLGAAFASLLDEQRGVARLYLQESRAPAVGAREPIAALEAEVVAGAIALTELAQAQGLLRPVDPRVSALAVIGAAERLLEAYLDGELGADGGETAGALVEIALGGLRPE